MDSGISEANDDVEVGLDPVSERLMDRFNKETAAIKNVLDWAHASIQEVNASFQVGAPSANPETLSMAGTRLDAVEEKLSAVRKRLKRIANENKDFKRDHANRTAAIRARVNQYKQLGQEFIDVTKELEDVRRKHRDALTRSVKADVMRANPAITEGQVDEAMANGDRGLDSVLVNSAGNAELRNQVADIRARNAEIQKLTKGLVELQNIFTDMSILVDGQQELINNIEYNVEEVHTTTKAGVGELEIARRHQKSKTKKKFICCIVLILIAIAGALAIIIPIGNSQGWFSGSKIFQPTSLVSDGDISVFPGTDSLWAPDGASHR